jgi:HEAT repeat protein
MSGQPEVRAEAATALGVLGDNTVIPTLMREIVNPNDLIRTATARALSLYPEEETAGPLTRTLTALDSMRMGALIRSLTAAGWKPVGVVLQLADSSDPYVVGIAVEILGGLQESRATDRLLALFADPGSRDLRPIISALGQSRDLRALDPLLKLAADPKRRAGKEAVVGEALADLGDQRGAAGITEMIRKSPSDAVTSQLKASCRKLTGRECR